MLVYRKIKTGFSSNLPRFYSLLNKNKKFIKFAVSGGSAAVADLILLYIFTDILNIWYILSASIAFVFAFFISFFLQKFWTFRDYDKERLKSQMGIFFTVGVVNLFINAGGMYALVDYFQVMYILAQIIMGAIIALGSYFIYNHIIFKYQKNEISC